MKIGVIGSGVVGRTLASGLVAKGHEAMLASRDPSKDEVQAWLAGAGGGAAVGTFADAAAFGELVILAVSGEGAEDAVALAGPDGLAGKVLIDATNPLEFSTGAPKLAFGFDDSLGERVQRAAPAALVVKAFNTVGAPYMVDPDLPGGPPDMFIAGDDDGAKAAVTSLLTELGWGTVDLGPIDASRLLEPLALVWVGYGVRTGGWDHAFKLLRKG